MQFPNNAARLDYLMKQEILAEVDDGGEVEVTWDDIQEKPETFAPTIGTTASTAMAGNTPVLSADAISAIAALTAESTLEDVIAALKS